MSQKTLPREQKHPQFPDPWKAVLSEGASIYTSTPWQGGNLSYNGVLFPIGLGQIPGCLLDPCSNPSPPCSILGPAHHSLASFLGVIGRMKAASSFRDLVQEVAGPKETCLKLSERRIPRGQTWLHIRISWGALKRSHPPAITLESLVQTPGTSVFSSSCRSSNVQQLENCMVDKITNYAETLEPFFQSTSNNNDVFL